MPMRQDTTVNQPTDEYRPRDRRERNPHFKPRFKADDEDRPRRRQRGEERFDWRRWQDEDQDD